MRRRRKKKKKKKKMQRMNRKRGAGDIAKDDDAEYAVLGEENDER